VTRAEARGLPGRDDCNADGVREAGWGARCDVGGGGFPAYGNLRCDAASDELSCRVPSSPARVVEEYRMPGSGPVVAVPGGLGVLQGRGLDVYRVEDDGSLTPKASLSLPRPAEDVAVSGEFAYLAEAPGLTVYSLVDRAAVASFPTCGKARRVFVEDGIVYVLGLRSLLILNAADPRAPVVLGSYRISATPGAARLTPPDRCGAVYRLVDLLCDATGICRMTGRVVAERSGHRLFLNLLDSTYAVDLAQPAAPVMSLVARTGLALNLAYEAPFLYVDGMGCGAAVFEEGEDGSWIWALTPDVPEWLRGVVDVGPFVVQRRPGRLTVATRQ
jgi:hypothetical protein